MKIYYFDEKVQRIAKLYLYAKFAHTLYLLYYNKRQKARRFECSIKFKYSISIPHIIRFWQADGESSFSPDILSDLITKAESECSDLLKLCKTAESDLQNSEKLLKELSDSFDELISWA